MLEENDNSEIVHVSTNWSTAQRLRSAPWFER